MSREIEEAITAAETARLSRALPGVEKELAGMEAALISKVFAAIAENSFNPQQAHYAWLELYSYRRLAKRLQTTVKMGNISARAAKEDGNG